MISEEAFTPFVTAQTRGMVRALVQALLPDIAAKLVQEEIDRIKAETIRAQGEGEAWSPSEAQQNSTKLPTVEASSLVDFEKQVQETFAPQIETIIRKLAQNQVAHTLPDVAERMTLEALKKNERINPYSH